MKSNWLTYVAITASLIAGFLCSTALADNKGMKFSGGGGGNSIRSSFSGGISGGSQMRTTQFQQNNFGGVQTQIKNHGLQSSGITGRNLGIQTQVKPLINSGVSGRVGQVLNGAGNGGTGISGIIKTPQTGPQMRPGSTLPLGIGPGSGQGGIKIGNSGIKIGNLGNSQGQGLGITLGNNHIKPAIYPKCHVAPKCIDPCFSKGCSPCGNVCSPCLKNWTINCQPWWWSCHTHYCNQPIYYPVCTRPIVVQVPVYVGVPVVQEQLMQVPVGSTITMQALGLGDLAGRLILVMDKVSLEGQVNEWNAGAVTATLPMFALAAPTPAELVIVKGDGQPATSMKIELIPAQPVQAAQQAAGVQQAQFNQPAGELSAAAALVQ